MNSEEKDMALAHLHEFVAEVEQAIEQDRIRTLVMALGKNKDEPVDLDKEQAGGVSVYFDGNNDCLKQTLLLVLDSYLNPEVPQ